MEIKIIKSNRKTLSLSVDDDMCAVVNNGLSEASKAQLVGKTGEEIVDADIAEQMKR